MTISRRHHYLPEFYLKGFTGDDNKLAVFNIEKNELNRNRFSTKQVFFEWNRNTFTIRGEETDFLEKLYQRTEDSATPIFKRIQEQKGTINIDALEMLHILLFTAQTYWRIPRTDKVIKEYVINSTPKQLHFTVRNKNTNEETSKENYKAMMASPAFIETYRIMKPLIEYIKSDPEQYLDDCKIYYASTDVELFLIGDNPIIFRDDNKTNIFNDEFIFPLSHGRTLYHTKGKIVKEIAPEDRMKVDVLIFLQASKYVCGANGAYIKDIASLAAIYANPLYHAHLKKQVFSVFE